MSDVANPLDENGVPVFHDAGRCTYREGAVPLPPEEASLPGGCRLCAARAREALRKFVLTNPTF